MPLLFVPTCSKQFRRHYSGKPELLKGTAATGLSTVRKELNKCNAMEISHRRVGIYRTMYHTKTQKWCCSVPSRTCCRPRHPPAFPLVFPYLLHPGVRVPYLLGQHPARRCKLPPEAFHVLRAVLPGISVRPAPHGQGTPHALHETRLALALPF